MNTYDMDRLLERQRTFFQTGATLPVEARLEALGRLRDTIVRYEERICAALRADLGKSAFESYMCEAGLVLSEISWLLKHTRRLARRKTVPTPLAQFAAHSYTQPSPRGSVLILSPWNYPFLLALDPLADAIAAGNTAILKPSAYAPATGQVIAELVAECFPPEHVAVVLGGRAENAVLLEKKFDLVFFTGSQAVGKEVLRKCAEHLTPAVLELGGKSPCIVDESAKIPLAAKRIVFAKFLNCGQTCVAPDYILCHASVKDRLIREIGQQITLQFGARPLDNPDYGKIISRRHFDRIRGLIDREKVFCGGEADEAACRIAPTVMDNVTWEDAVMQAEIFGPVLPVLTFDDLKDIPTLLANREKPLALYLFTQSRAAVDFITTRCQYGGGCVNDAVIHLATSEMGFGGVGESGMGCYHGKAGFDAFSHRKSMVDKKTWMDLPMRYQPYRAFHEKLLRFFLK
ncbi:MAG: aldehyde dehydrogenase [Clostridia bacterium]|nr:aldehyde dehydrogenase [Clostridia bacterium]